MTLDEAVSAKRLCYWSYGSVVECKPTGRYIDARIDSLVNIEIRERGLFGAKKWIPLVQLDHIQEKQNATD